MPMMIFDCSGRPTTPPHIVTCTWCPTLGPTILNHPPPLPPGQQVHFCPDKLKQLQGLGGPVQDHRSCLWRGGRRGEEVEGEGGALEGEDGLPWTAFSLAGGG